MNPVNTTVTGHVYIGLKALKAFTPDYRYGHKPSPHNCGQDIICLLLSPCLKMNIVFKLLLENN